MVYFVTLGSLRYWKVVNALIHTYWVDIVMRVIDKVKWHGRTIALHSCSFEVGGRHDRENDLAFYKMKRLTTRGEFKGESENAIQMFCWM
jgi:hypothetical protein